MLAVEPIAAFETNYIWVIVGPNKQYCTVVDPGDAKPVIEFLRQQRLKLDSILITHHHSDHVGGVAELCQYDNVPVYGPKNETIPCLTHPLTENNRLIREKLELELDVIDVPGHTKGHIAYYGHQSLFIGDTLFSAGCGRMLEGTAQQFHRSLEKLKVLPDDTRCYCAHEYTLANLAFAQVVEPDNLTIIAKVADSKRKRQQQLPTIPMMLGDEKKLNPFLRYDAKTVKQAAEKYSKRLLQHQSEVFAALRAWKDQF